MTKNSSTLTCELTTVAMLDYFPAVTTIRAEFPARITLCDVIMHKVYCFHCLAWDF
jgi:hypothetical protein